jgi:mono/diheme cytochrome c family protein
MKKLVVVPAMLLLATSLFAADGKAVYAKCAGCHGADGSKENKAMGVRPLSGADAQKATDAEWTAIVSKGKGKMPGYEGKLSADEIKAVVDYMRTLKK